MMPHIKRKNYGAGNLSATFLDSRDNGNIKLEEMDADYGHMKAYIRPGTSDELIIKENWYKSSYKGEYYSVLPERVIEDMYRLECMLDVGAHIGTYAIRAATQFSIPIVCYEPYYPNYTMLVENIVLNKLQNRVLPYNKAIVSSNEEEIVLYTRGGTNASLNSIIPVKGRMEIKVPADNIDNVIRNFKIDAMKMDIEGAENIIIPEMKSLGKLKFVIMEFHCKDNFGDSYYKMLEILSGNFSEVSYVPEPKNMFGTTIIAAWNAW